MGETIIEKIIRHNTGKAVKPGDIVTVNVDRVMIHDIFIPFVADKFEEMGFQKLWDPDKVVLIYDHLVPASQQDDTRHFHVGDAFAAKYGMKNVHRSDGICHQLMTEAGYVKPGNIVFGTDSHTTTYGCVGAFSSGIGYTEMASILGTGTMWIKVPETIKVVIDGELPENVMSKDIILRLIGDLRADGATYRALEFSGSTIENMSVASRMTMANMAIEAGAKCALFTPDEKTAAYCETELDEFQKSLVGDEDAVYMKTMTYKAEDFNDILRYNYVSFGMPGYSKEKEELYHWVYNELISKGEEIVPMAGYWEDDLWYQAISDQRYYGWGQSDPDHTDYFNHLNASDASYILVLKDSQIYADEQAYFDSLERIYDTGIGFVARKELYE
mgnify:CR=1 FL=1